MGYCFTGTGALVCDHCNDSGGVRKHRCPFGYCPAPALHAACKAKILAEKGFKTRREAHIAFGCKAGHEKFEAKRKAESALLASGHYLNNSNLRAGTDGKAVYMWFKGADGEYLTLVPHAVYETARAAEKGIRLLTLREVEALYGKPLPVLPLDYPTHQNAMGDAAIAGYLPELG